MRVQQSWSVLALLAPSCRSSRNRSFAAAARKFLLRRARYLVLAASTLTPLVAQESKPFYLHPNDTVVFYGDSITDQRLYTMLTELFIVTRYPRLPVTFVHSGWGGDRVSGGGGGPIDLRLERDVFAYKPTVMTIMLGMNDGRYTQHTPADDDAYYAGYRHIVESARHTIPNLRITAIEPSPFDDATRPPGTVPAGGYNAVLVNYAKWIAGYATQAHFDTADLNTGVVQMLHQANDRDSAVAQKIIPDRVHPALGGHLIMAEQLLKAWNARPVVAAVTIDASSHKIVDSAHAKISDLKSGNTLSWTELDDALPLPFASFLNDDHDHSGALAITSSDVTEALNQEPLRITGLKPGNYTLKIDGQPIGTFPDSQLSQGLNLAVLATPMAKQAKDVYSLTLQHLEVHQFRWRTLQVPFHDAPLPKMQQTLSDLDAAEAEIVVRQRATAQPHPHAFGLVPAS